LPSSGLKLRSTDSAAPHADTHCPTSLAARARRDRVVCACTHYLVFKEPTAGAPVAPHRRRLEYPRSSRALASRALVPPARSCLTGPGRLSVATVFRGTF